MRSLLACPSCLNAASAAARLRARGRALAAPAMALATHHMPQRDRQQQQQQRERGSGAAPGGAGAASTSGRSGGGPGAPSFSGRSSTASGGGRGAAVAARAGKGAAAAGGGGAPAEGAGYWTLERYVVYESEVKKSRFVVHAWPAASAAEALSLIRAASDASASHNCFAYRVGPEYRSADDGEPGGTAGRPILGAIEGEGLDCVAVLVTRYFGGIKLGAGGLARAYGGAAKECLKLAPRRFARAQVEVAVEVAYDELGVVYGALDSYGCVRLGEDYGNGGTVVLRARADVDVLHDLAVAVRDATGGRRRVRTVTAAGGGGDGDAQAAEAEVAGAGAEAAQR